MLVRQMARREIGGSLSSRRAWIEMSSCTVTVPSVLSRSPHGERGLKWHVTGAEGVEQASLSSRRAWIEITFQVLITAGVAVSLSSRRAWIEISASLRHCHGVPVALLTESVD